MLPSSTLAEGNTTAHDPAARRTCDRRRHRDEHHRGDADLERQWRLGQALHDGLCQELAGVSFACEAYRQQVESDGAAAAADALDRIALMVLKVLDDARRIADDLSPVDPRPDGLTVALGELAARTAVSVGARVRFTCRGAIRVCDRRAADHLFRVAERAVEDAVFTGGARRVTVSLARTAAGVHLTVAAHPRIKAHPPRTALPKTTWQTNVKRTKALGGRLTIATSARTGATTVACVLPDGPALG